MNSWRSDVSGAIVFATWQFMQRNAKVTFYGWYVADLVSGHQLQLLNADESRTFATINMHGTRLYALEANGAARGAGAGSLPAVADVSRQRGQIASVSEMHHFADLF